MCNFLLEQSEEIPEVGIGWKIVQKHGAMIYVNNMPAKSLNKYKYKDRQNFIHWRKGVKTDTKYEGTYLSNGQGFCFFLTKEEAKLSLKALKQKTPFNLEIKKIEYQKGLGVNTNIRGTKFCLEYQPIRIALCKKFRFASDKASK